MAEQLAADLEEVKGKIVATEKKLENAEAAGNQDFILMYGQNLAELRKKENDLRQGNSFFLLVAE